MIVENIEKILNEKAEDWNENTLEKIVNDENIIQMMSDKDQLQELSDSLNEKNLDFSEKFILPALLVVKMKDAEKEISGEIEIFENGEELNPSNILKKAKEFIDQDNSFLKLIGFLTILNYEEEDYDFGKEKEEIFKAVKESFDFVENKDMNQYFYLNSEFLDIIYPISEAYFQRKEEEFFDEDFQERLEKFQERINEFSLKLVMEFNKIQEEIRSEQENTEKKDDE